MGGRSLLNLIFDGFEGVLDKSSYFESGRTHTLLINLRMLDEFKEMRIFDLFASVKQLHVLLHLLLEIEGEQTKLQLIALFLAPHPVLSWRYSAYDIELLSD